MREGKRSKEEEEGPLLHAPLPPNGVLRCLRRSELTVVPQKLRGRKWRGKRGCVADPSTPTALTAEAERKQSEPPADQGKSGKSAPGRKSMLENKRQTTWKGEDASKKGTPKDQNAWKAETRSPPRPPERLRGEKGSIKQTSPE